MLEPIYVEEAYSLRAKEVLKKLDTSKKGLSSEEAIQRQEIYPSNELIGVEPPSLFEIFRNQFKDILIIILIIAAILSIVIEGEEGITDAIVIMIILVINAVFGTRQEWKADKAIQALQSMTASICQVVRDSNVIEISTKDLIPGDIIRIEAGVIIPADSRVVEAVNLKTVEAPLTGESTEVRKFATQKLPLDTGVPERSNMLFSGTHVSMGRGLAVVVGTGMRTQFGQIADLVSGLATEQTPIQKKLAQLGTQLGQITIGICGVVVAIGYIAGNGLADMFLLGISLAVAAIPEGLPIVVTLAMALGVQKMASRHAIVRKLPAVEALGAASVICTDKTGTLTLNKMTVRRLAVFSNGHNLQLTRPEDVEKTDNEVANLFRSGVLCNNAKLTTTNGKITEVGDPTEVALLRVANDSKLNLRAMESRYLLRDELPFDSERKRMTTVHEDVRNNEFLSYTKGAPDILLEMCEGYLSGDDIIPLTDEIRNDITQKIGAMADDALRVLAFAFKPMDKSTPVWNILEMEKGLVFIGLMGLIDPPKPEVYDAVGKCQAAGVSIKIVTGDHRRTAAAIGRELGISSGTEEVITGDELDRLNDVELRNNVSKYSIFARISPAHKLRIVQAIKSNGRIVGMTGDGVNDAPALKAADIGIAMGIQGTDVTKETSDMVLADDNFATIVAAIEEGRAVYQSMGKFLRYMLSSNFAEILVIVIALLVGLPPPFIPIQILWINLVTDGLPALALGVDPPERGLMDKPPRDPTESIMNKAMGKYILRLGIYMTIISVGVYGISLGGLEKGMNISTDDPTYIYASTMTFATLSILQLFHSYNVRSEIHSVLGKEFFANRALVWATLVSALLQVFVIQGDQWISSITNTDYEYFSSVFEVTPLEILDWIIILIVTSSLILFEEIFKFRKRRIEGI
ncbi:MAG: cation-translocating P-type ATPase [Candidatus Kariarchaeaceae archaeon]